MKTFLVESSFMTNAESAEEAARLYVAKRGVPKNQTVHLWDYDLNPFVFDVTYQEQAQACNQ